MYYIMKVLLIIYWFFGTQDLIQILWDVAFVFYDTSLNSIGRISYYIKAPGCKLSPDKKDQVCPEAQPIIDMGLLFKSNQTFEDDKFKMKLFCVAAIILLIYVVLFQIWEFLSTDEQAPPVKKEGEDQDK